jgi:hypothetical protein
MYLKKTSKTSHKIVTDIECGRIKQPDKDYSWIFNVLVAFDQLGNAIAFGNPDRTVSARVGYFSLTGPFYLKWYWRFLERVINLAFWPVDGRNHCRQAMCADPIKDFNLGNQLGWFLLSILVLVFCIVIGILLYLVYPFYRKMQKFECPDCSGIKGEFPFDKKPENLTPEELAEF